MIQRILKILKENAIDTYLIGEQKEESVELFFVRKALDMNRRKEVIKYSVTVYRDFEKDNVAMRGASVANVYKSMTDEEIKEVLCDAYYAASFVTNPYYEIPKGIKEDRIVMPSSLGEKELEETAKLFTEALFKNDREEDCFINSAEIFVHKETQHIMSSEGVDVSYTKHHVEGEFVVQCTVPQDVEGYKSFYYENLELEALATMVQETLNSTKARGEATKPPKEGQYKVILSGEYVKTLLSYYLDRAGSHMIYPKYSNFKVGDKIQGEIVKGDKLNISVKPVTPYSQEGIQMMERPLVKNGVLQMIHGASRFGYYLGIEPTGYYTTIALPKGSRPLKEMEVGEYLHVVNFSDFQMDPFTGYFGGEIRLAFYSNGKEVIPVTGGSISGDIKDVQGQLIFTEEMQIEKGYEGPYAVCLNGVTVAGGDK